MGIINCPECGKQISDKAISCPGCGFPMKKNRTLNSKVKKSHFGNNILLFVVCFFATFLIFSFLLFKLWKPSSISKSTMVSTNPNVEIQTKNLSADGKHLRYINDHMKIVGGDVDYFEDYDEAEKLGIEKLKIKNNGNKDIDALEITVCFLDKNGKVVHSTSTNAFGSLDTGMKSYQAWEMEEDLYLQLENVPRDINVSEYAIVISNVRFKGEKNYRW